MWAVYIALLEICIISYLIHRKRLLDLTFPMVGLLCSSMLVEIGKAHYEDNFIGVVLTHVYQPIEVFWLLLLYSKSIRSNLYQRNYKSIIFFYAVFALTMSYYLDGIDEKNTASFLLESILIISLSLYTMYEQYKEEPDDTPVLKQAFFWINTGNLFFFAISFVEKALHNHLYEINEGAAVLLSEIVMIANFLLYGMYLIGSLCKRKDSTYV